MNANELQPYPTAKQYADALAEIEALNKTLHQQDYEIQDLAEWKRSLMEVNSQQQAEIEALKAENQFFKDLMGDVEILKKDQEK